MSGILITLVWLFTSSSSWFLIMASSYINVYLCLKEMDQYWKILMAERSSLDKYRFATDEELEEKCDDVCAVCLTRMSHSARVRHFYLFELDLTIVSQIGDSLSTLLSWRLSSTLHSIKPNDDNLVPDV